MSVVDVEEISPMEDTVLETEEVKVESGSPPSTMNEFEESQLSGGNGIISIDEYGRELLVKHISIDLAYQTASKIILEPLYSQKKRSFGKVKVKREQNGHLALVPVLTKAKVNVDTPPVQGPFRRRRHPSPPSSSRHKANVKVATKARKVTKGRNKSAALSPVAGTSRSVRTTRNPNPTEDHDDEEEYDDLEVVGEGAEVTTVTPNNVIMLPCASGLTSCGKEAFAEGGNDGELFPCRRCHQEFYCSAEHQEENKERHSPLCKTSSKLEVIPGVPAYKKWLDYVAKENYEICLNFVLIWPSLTIQWFPDRMPLDDEELDDNLTRHKLLLGTQTQGLEKNHLLICALDTWSDFKNRGELRVLQRINHDGDVQRARIHPGMPNIVATKSAANVSIFNLESFPELPEDDSTFAPTLRLGGLGSRELGFSLCWSPQASDARVVSGSNDGRICLWDINGKGDRPEDAGPSSNRSQGILSAGCGVIPPLSTLHTHTSVVEDVSWCFKSENILASVGDDEVRTKTVVLTWAVRPELRLILWDLRQPDPIQIVENAHNGDVNAVAFSPDSEHCLATGGADKTIKIWDTRRFPDPITSIRRSHKEQVLRVEWSPHNPTLIAGAGNDTRVLLFDFANLANKRRRKEIEFSHEGHVQVVNDIAFCPDIECCIASVAADNILQVWKPTKDLGIIVDDEEESSSETSDEEAEEEMNDLDVEN